MLNYSDSFIKDSTNNLIQQEEDHSLLKTIQPVGFFKLFRFADRIDYILIFIGSITSLSTGAGLPILIVLFGDMINSIGTITTLDQIVESCKNIMFQFFYLGAGIFVCSWVTFFSWMIAGQRQGIVCRKTYLMKLLQQEIGWFDRVNQIQLGSKFGSETFSFQSAIGEKVGAAITVVSCLATSMVIAMYKGWQLGLVVISSVPFMALMAAIYVGVLQDKEQKTRKFYISAGGKAQEVIGSIKTVKSLNGQNYQKSKFNETLDQATKNTINYVTWAGFGMGGLLFSVFLSFALAFWYGSKLISDQTMANGQLYDSGKVLTIFFSLCMGATGVSNIAPSIQKFTEGKQAAARIYSVIDRKPRIYIAQNGKKLEKVNGIIRFENVTFAYPKEPKKIILKNLSFQMRSNQTNALVGESGCGKSTIMQLILRFYDPNEGRITLDGIDLRQFDLAWLRSIIGYVGQQPVLFATTIKQNLLYGKPTATNQQIQQALKKAEAFQFISQLEDGLETNVGYGGGQFSGGQKQRIAIARAILKDPKILLLDEATSALDRKNQRLIQQTLDKIVDGRTTITIAHRIKTIMHAQQIFVMQDGMLKQHGVFKQLKKFKDIEFVKKITRLQKIKVEQLDKQQQQNENKNVQQNNKKQTKVQKDEKDEKEENEEEQIRKQLLLQKYGGQVFSRLFKYNMPDLWIFIIGVVVAIGNGTIFPLFTMYVAKLQRILFEISYGAPQSNANDTVIKFILVGVGSFIATGLQTSIFLVIGEKITKRLRCDAFSKIIHMPVSWFDLPRNNSGTLAARLSTDCQLINGLTSSLIGVNLQIISTLLSSIIIAFYYQWRTALVTLGILPILMGVGSIRMKFMTGFSAKTDQAYKDSTSLIMESMTNIRTVMSFGVENSISQIYSKKLDKPISLAYSNANLSGILFAVSQFSLYATMALIFYIGSLFMKYYNANFDQVITAIYVILFSTLQAGTLIQNFPDVGASKNAAVNLFQLLDDEDESMIQLKHNSKMIKKTEFRGFIQIKNITFKYPTRVKQIFKNFSMKIEPGKKIALVGPSGCGKSTIIQLLLRFYEPNQGQIFLDNINIKDYDVQYLRSLFGLVSQQPVLFDASFKQNIQYNLQNITMQNIRDAAKRSHALNFIEGDQEIQQINLDKQVQKGFDRNVGIKGSHISGGQKQRVAIARTILRNPKILLLDEATSALDNKNQKIVQKQLDQIMNGLATITIAHRIQTIKNSDQIFVFDEGKIVESGKYKELVDLKGHLFHLEQGSLK